MRKNILIPFFLIGFISLYSQNSFLASTGIRLGKGVDPDSIQNDSCIHNPNQYGVVSMNFLFELSTQISWRGIGYHVLFFLKNPATQNLIPLISFPKSNIPNIWTQHDSLKKDLVFSSTGIWYIEHTIHFVDPNSHGYDCLELYYSLYEETDGINHLHTELVWRGSLCTNGNPECLHFSASGTNERYGFRSFVNQGANEHNPIGIYPNPFGDQINIEIPSSFETQQVKIDLFSSNGTLVFSKMINHSSIFGNSNYKIIKKEDILPKGFYLIRVNIDEHVYSKKIIKL